MKKLLFNLLLSLLFFLCIGFLMKLSMEVLRLIESWLKLKIDGSTQLTEIIELIGYLILLPILAYIISRLLFQVIPRNYSVMYNQVYFVQGFVLITLITILIIYTWTNSKSALPFYENTIALYLMKFKEAFSKNDYRIFQSIGVVIHNFLLSLYGILWMNRFFNFLSTELENSDEH